MKYTYFQTATIAAVDNIANAFSNFEFVSNSKRHQPFPVFIASTGDETFMSMMSDRLHVKPKSDTLHVPSMSLDIADITLSSDSKTNSVENAKFVLTIDGASSEKMKSMTAYPSKITVNCTVLFSNIFQYLAFIEYIYNGIYKRNTFNFTYWGKYQEAVWTLTTETFEPTFDRSGTFGTAPDGSSHTLSLSFEVYCKYPSFGLNNTLGANVDDDQDGIKEGGIGGAATVSDTDAYIDANSVIKGVVDYNDLENINNVATTMIIGEVNDDLLKKSTN